MLDFLAHLLPTKGNAPPQESFSVPGHEALAPLDDFAGNTLQVINAPRQILHILRGIAQARRPITLSSHHLPQNVTTRLLGVEPSMQQLLIRQLTDEKAHNAVLQDAHINIFTHHGDSPLMTSVDISAATAANGLPCYATSLPALLLHFQMRSNPRVHIPETRHVTLWHAFPDKERIEARVIDISEGGLGLILHHLPLRGISRHEWWHEASLGGSDGEIGRFTLQLRRVILTATGQQFIGASIESAPEAALQRLRRLIMSYQTKSTRHT